MNHSIHSNATEGVLLQEATAVCSAFTVTYRLSAVARKEGTCFLIAAETRDDIAQAELFVPLATAVRSFQAVIEGKVMPCTLRDVLADLQYLENF